VGAFESSDFYTTCAQILPVIFLAGAIELRLFTVTQEEIDEWKSLDTFGTNAIGRVLCIIGFVTTVALGELAALRVLFEERVLAWADGVIVVALVASAAVLLLMAVDNIFNTLDRYEKKEADAKSSHWTIPSYCTALLLLLITCGAPILQLTMLW
jgi:hypothetical protein